MAEQSVQQQEEIKNELGEMQEEGISDKEVIVVPGITAQAAEEEEEKKDDDEVADVEGEEEEEEKDDDDDEEEEELEQ